MSVFRVAARRALPLVCASGVWLGPTPPAWADALWLDGSGRPLAAAHTVVDWLTHAERDGLQPADYGAADLARAVAAAQAQAPSADEVARLDTALTDAATRYLQQLRYGRVDATRQLNAHYDSATAAPTDLPLQLR